MNFNARDLSVALASKVAAHPKRLWGNLSKDEELRKIISRLLSSRLAKPAAASAKAVDDELTAAESLT